MPNPPNWLKALGSKPQPGTVEVGGRAFALERTFKNDFFAVTAVYQREGERIVVKINRTAHLFLVPLSFVGRFLASREAAVLAALEDVKGVPRLLERLGPTGVAREFVPGEPLRRGMRVGDSFHAQLRALIDEMHKRGLAYVDLEKCENVLVGDDGKPYLFDFQISWFIRRGWLAKMPPMGMLRRFLQRGDLYHLAKLQRRTRPDQMTEQQLVDSYRRPWYVRLHRRITYPFTFVRRWFLNRIDPRRGDGERGRIS